jgi:hypothetical protein
MLESQRDQSADGRASLQQELPFLPVQTAQKDDLRATLSTLNPDELTPKAALDALYQLRKLL